MALLKEVTLIVKNIKTDALDLIQGEIRIGHSAEEWLEEWERIHHPFNRHSTGSYMYQLIGIIDGLVGWSRFDFGDYNV